MLSAILELQPDFVAFQEVTDEFMKIAHDHKGWADTYVPSSPWKRSTEENWGYWAMLWRRGRPFAWVDDTEFPDTTMGRRLVIGTTEVISPGGSKEGPDGGLTLATGHLESLPEFKKHRQAQLGVVFDTLSQVPNALYVGDTNLMNGETAVLPKGWEDAALHPVHGKPEVTFDAPAMRPMVRGPYRDRLDRCFYRLADWELREMSILGKDPIEGGAEPKAWMSDHYGVHLVFTAVGKPASTEGIQPPRPGKGSTSAPSKPTTHKPSKQPSKQRQGDGKT